MKNDGVQNGERHQGENLDEQLTDGSEETSGNVSNEPAPVQSSPEPALDLAPSSSNRFKDFMDTGKDLLAAIAFVWVVSGFIGLLLWEARIEPWLFSRMQDRIELPENDAWFREQVVLSLADDRQQVADNIISAFQNKPILDGALNPFDNAELDTLFARSDFQERFQKEVILGLLNRDDTRAQEILDRFSDEKLLEVLLDPPSVSALSGTVTQQVDALYTLQLSYQRRQLIRDGIVVKDSDGSTVYAEDSNIRNRFYANRNQNIEIELIPNSSGLFREAFTSGEVALFLVVGASHKIPIPQGGFVENVTCVVQEALRGREAGFVLLRANTDSGVIPEGGYELEIVITARKGGAECVQ
ncbi:hypothetical protein [Marivita sp.]|uniref:hypothetical protein n=1 Tax=Marivita sp. TaxID=2003365 RepID=UPI003F4A869E